MNTFGLYLHWPFCLKKCPYCDFNSYATPYKEEEWVQALIDELDLHSKIFKNYKLETIFFGGGTPSLISAQNIERILSKINSIWPYKNIEISIECNPSSIEINNLEAFMQSGINRFSIGVQSLNDEKLKFLGRIHSANEALSIVQHAAKICKNISTDFIYSLPNDSIEIWKKELDTIINILLENKISHCSLYQLTIEENTGFYKEVENKIWYPMNDDLQSELYIHTHKTMQALNWDHYEISNFAAKKEYKSQHNLRYWEYQNYLGIGPGAHSRMFLNNEKIRFNNIKTPQKWRDLIYQSKEFPFLFIQDYAILSQKEQIEEKLFMGFRLKDGINLSTEDLNFVNQEHLEYLIQKKLINQKANQYKLSINAQLKLNAVLKLLFL